MFILWLLITFSLMEFAAWSLHKYVMHGPLWVLHKDHHTPRKGHFWQLNDAFAIFFAIPSFLFILFDSIWDLPMLGAIGYGIALYGAVYFFVHEVLIHRRLKFFNWHGNRYIDGLRTAHRHHHQIAGKYGARNFGMLVVSFKYFKGPTKDPSHV